MKYLLLVVTAFSFQTGLFAQSNNRPQSRLEVGVQQVPVDKKSNEENDEEEEPTAINNVRTQKSERTLSIIKPDGVRNRHIGDVISRFEDKGLHIIAIKMVKLDKDQASKFYSVHKDRPFFKNLVNFMTSGPIVVMILEGPNAISKNREIMGATNPTVAERGSIRAEFGQSMTENTVHGSDNAETAKDEMAFFFKPNEIFPYYPTEKSDQK